MRVALVALGLLVATAAQAGSPFAELQVSDPRAKQMWSDEFKNNPPTSYGNRKSRVLVFETMDNRGKRITFTQIDSSSNCGAQTCASRLFVDGKLVQNFQACLDTEFTEFTNEGRVLRSCDATVAIP